MTKKYTPFKKNTARSRQRLLCGLCIVLIIFMTACSSREEKTASPKSTEEITTEDLLKNMSDQEKCWMDLTQEQYLEDFDTLYQELEKNYPYFGVAQRKSGINIPALYKKYRSQFQACTNDNEFWGLIQEFSAEIEYTGHLQAWGYRYSSELAGLKSTIQEFPQYKEDLIPYINALDNPVSEKNYKRMEQFYTRLQQQADQENAANSVPAEEEADLNQDTEPVDNVTTEIIEAGKIAYVNIGMFDMDSYAKDKKKLIPFYKKIQNYDHLIIDITDNSGGGMDYFNQLVAAPCARKTYKVSAFLLTKGGENNKQFLQLTKGLQTGKWMPISQLPSLSHINLEDLSGLDYFMQEDYTVHPSDQQGFQGQIWLLVSQKNYSSSEYAAMFSKQSGFATLVGENTGGDGIGVDPAYVILPNSGLVVQYSPIYGVTPDGKNSEEYGTEPDYYVQSKETALDACLRLIRQQTKP